VADIVEVGVFQKGWVTLSANFRWKRTSPDNICWYQKTRLITFHVMSKFQLYVLSFRHKARVWRTDRQTDRQTERITIPKDRASIAASRGKREHWTTFCERYKQLSQQFAPKFKRQFLLAAIRLDYNTITAGGASSFVLLLVLSGIQWERCSDIFYIYLQSKLIHSCF